MLNFLPKLVLLYVFISTALFSQDFLPEFNRLTTREGLSSNMISAVTQDSSGFIWIGTLSGLNRYDGYDFKKFYSIPDLPNTLTGDDITNLAFTSNNILWIGTDTKGLVKYDLISNLFLSYENIGQGILTDSDKGIAALFADEESNYLWVGTWEGNIYCVNCSEETPGNPQVTTFHKNNPIYGDIRDIIKYDSTRFLIAAHSGLYLLKMEDSGEYEYTLLLSGNPDLYDPEININLYKSGDEIILVKTIEDKSYFVIISIDDIGKINLDLKLTTPEIQTLNERIIDCISYRNGILFAAYPNKLFYYDPKLGRITDSVNLVEKSVNVSESFLGRMFVDATGKLWITTTSGGLYCEKDDTKIFNSLRQIQGDKNSLSAISIRGILEDEPWGLWIGGYNGLSLLNPRNNIVKRYNVFAGGSDFNEPVWAISKIPGDDNFLLLGAEGAGLFLINKSTGKLIPFWLESSSGSPYIHDSIYSLYIDNNRIVWAGTPGGLVKFNLPDNYDNIKGDLIAEIFIFSELEEEVEDQYLLNFILPSSDSTLLLGTENYGIISWNKISNSFVTIQHIKGDIESLSSNSVNSIYKSEDGNVWVSTMGGLNKWNPEDYKNLRNKFTRYDIRDGLPNNTIYEILEDENNHLWISTTLGLSHFNPFAETFRNYTETDGILNDKFNAGSAMKSSSGVLYFGGISGLTYFTPEETENIKTKIDVVFTDFKVFNKPFNLEKEISHTNNIDLAYNENVFSLTYSALNFTTPDKIEYAYMLEGLDSSWTSLGTNRQVSFANVGSGTYRLKVKARHFLTEWSDNVAELSVTINPPFWLTWWMFSIYFVVLLIIFITSLLYERNRQAFKHSAELAMVETEKLKEVNKLKSDFFANISHELRTPLTLIMGMLESVMPFFKNKSGNEEINELEKKIKIAYKSGGKQLNLVNQILSLTKIDAGEEKLNTSVKNIEPLIRYIAASFESTAKLKGIELSYTSDFNVVPVDFDNDKIEIIMNNLLSNATKFTHRGGKIIVNVESGLKMSDFDSGEMMRNRSLNREVRILVQDTGIGIPKGKLENIFDRFYQVDSTASRKYEGTGIGLSLTMELVQLHSGSISVESTEEKGSIFKISLPMNFNHTLEEIEAKDTPGIEIPDQSSEEREEIKTVIPKKSHGESILIVEDNPDMRFYISDTLKTDYNIIEASNGKEGIDIALEEIPDLIITDVMMPEMNGYELTKILRENKLSSHIPIIMITARASEEDKFTGLEAGVDAYLTKPFSTKELSIRVCKLLELRASFYKKMGEEIYTNPTELKIHSLDQQLLGKLKDEVENNISNANFSVNELAGNLALSKRQLERKLKAVINITPAQYIRTLRLKRAKELLEKGAGNVSDITFEVGYTNFAAFSKAFKEEFGISPSQVNSNKN